MDFKKLGLGAALAVSLPALAAAQSVTVVRELDSNKYDPPAITALAGSEVLFMIGDTLVALDEDMSTIHPLLAKSWEVSEDGKTYTFHLRDDVTFCDGKKFTAADVVYTIKRWIDPATKSGVAWRAGDVKDVVAIDDYTVEYQLNAPFSELLYQLAQSFGTIIDEENVKALGADFGVTGMNGTGPFCWVSWEPRNQFVMKRHDAYKWGPANYENPGPAKVEEIIYKVVPEGSTRTVALLTNQAQISPYIPEIGLGQLRKAPNIEVVRSDQAFFTNFIGFKIDKPGMGDPAVRKAMNLAVNQQAIAEDLFFGEVDPAYSYISPGALDYNKEVDPILLKTDIEEAKKILDEAGWVLNSDGVREKDGVKLEPTVYSFIGTWAKVAEAVQADLLKIGVNMQIQTFDPTVIWGKLATQEFDMFTMGFPYVSAGDALNLYFLSRNMPSPNRMNWNDPETDELLAAGKAAVTGEERAADYGKVLMKVHEAAVWIPIYHEPMQIAYSSKMAPIKPHNIYGCGLYKGLDIAYLD
ncbi:MAG: ABC transporter substrate-binding protein [Pseudomonadota bacterium]|nr:ABC transporter substrate-binding protein [Pseudomonadota bacterium]